MIHFDRTVVILLLKHFRLWLSAFFKYSSIITNCTYTAMNKSSIMVHVNTSFTLFKSSYCIWCLFITDCLSLIFHLDYTRWWWFMFLIHFDKSQCCWRRNYISHMLISPTFSVHFLLTSNTRHVQPWVVCATLC